jgi:hypothetical protein
MKRLKAELWSVGIAGNDRVVIRLQRGDVELFAEMNLADFDEVKKTVASKFTEDRDGEFGFAKMSL